MRPSPHAAPSNPGTAWIDEIPAHWRARQLGRIGRLFKANGGTKADEVAEGVPCVRYGDIYTQHEFFVLEARSRVSDERAGAYTPIRIGDVLFAASGETLEEIGKSVVSLLRSRACCGGDVIVFRPTAEVYARFMGFATDCRVAAIQKLQMGRGMTVMHIYGDQLKRMWIALPPLAEQRSIASFLDRETEKIDALVAKKQRLIDLLQEKRAALISRAVTKGLDPDVPMKDSGVEWLGVIPAHWGAGIIRRAARLESGHTPSRQHPEYWEDCSVPWFTLADIWQVRPGIQEYVSETSECVSEVGLAHSSARLLPAGTVLLSRTASVGFSAIAKRPMATSQHFANWVCGDSLLPEYLLYVYRSMRGELLRLTMGSTHKTIYMPIIAKLAGPLPSVHEQRLIVEHVRRETRRVDALGEKLVQAVERLTEYRSALITAAVTGQIDVQPGNHVRVEDGESQNLGIY